MANPEGKEYDKDDLRELAFIVYYKVLLYYLTDEVSYYDDIRKISIIIFLIKNRYES